MDQLIVMRVEDFKEMLHAACNNEDLSQLFDKLKQDQEHDCHISPEDSCSCQITSYGSIKDKMDARKEGSPKAANNS